MNLQKKKSIKRITEIIMRAIPYSMMLLFKLGDKIQTFLSHQHFNIADSSKIMLDEFVIAALLNYDNIFGGGKLMSKCNKVNIPHKGWEYIGMEDLGEDICPGENIQYQQCEMCGNEKIRYVHLLKHSAFDGEIRVGCVCASNMINDYDTPQEKENNLKNRVNRKRNFMKQSWRYKQDTGNYTLRYKGKYITIMKSKFGSDWGVIFQGEKIWEYHGRKIDDLDTAKIVAFNLFDELHESRHQEQPYWDGDRLIYI